MLAAIIAPAQPALAPVAKAWGIYVDALDVAREPRAGGSRYGVDISTVQCRVAGWGGVSTMSFLLDDPSNLLTVEEGDAIRWRDLATDQPLFDGYVSRYSVRDAFGQVGREWSIDAVGHEAILDWILLGQDVTIATGTLVATAIQQLAAAAIGSINYGLRAEGPTSLGGDPKGNATQTIGDFGTDVINQVTIERGTPLREAIRKLGDTYTPSAGQPFQGFAIHLDLYRGLRVFEWDAPADGVFLAQPDLDFAVGGGGGQPWPEPLDHDVDGTSLVRAVIVKGNGVASTRYQGQAKPGRVAYVRDTSITTQADADAAGDAYLGDANRFAGARGTVRLTDTTWRPARMMDSALVITRPNVPQAAGHWVTFATTLTPHGDDLDATIEYGGPKASLARQAARVIRPVLVRDKS